MPANKSAAKKAETETLSVGDKAPDFNLPVDGGGTLSLSALKGKKVVLYFYPRDDTPGCTLEAKDFAENMGKFEKAGAVIIGVSKDSVASHDKFKGKYCLPFALASDEGANVCESYGVWVEKNNYGKKYMGIERTTFLIDGSGLVARIWNKVKVDGHVLEVLEAVNNT